MKTLLVWFLLTSVVFAEDVVQYTGTTYQGCRSISDTTIFLTDPNDLKTAKEGFIVIDTQTCATAPFAAIPERYRKIDKGEVVQMTVDEMADLDAPTPEQLKQQAYQEELIKLGCTHELTEVDAEWDKAATVEELRELGKQEARCRRALQR